MSAFPSREARYRASALGQRCKFSNYYSNTQSNAQ